MRLQGVSDHCVITGYVGPLCDYRVCRTTVQSSVLLVGQPCDYGVGDKEPVQWQQPDAGYSEIRAAHPAYSRARKGPEAAVRQLSSSNGA